MSELLSHIFGNESHTPVQARDPNLMQGERFDFMQNAITSRVLPALPLMEQTTGPGIGSIVEPLEVASSSDNKDQYDSVAALNESEMGKLQQMENQYQNLVAQLLALNSTSSNPTTYKPEVKELPFFFGTHIPIEEESPTAANIHNQIKQLNVKINASINKLIKQTEKTHGVNSTAKDIANTHGQNLRSQLNTLMERKSRLDSLLAKRETLKGQLEDRRRELDSSYLHYIAWFLSAVTLGALAFNKLAKN